MSGKDKIISGIKNRAMIGMSNILPDTTFTSMMGKQQKPAMNSLILKRKCSEKIG
jgi:hypothetical protein